MEIEIDHTEVVHDDKETFLCKFKSFKHRSPLYRHLNAHKNELFKSNYCRKVFARGHYLNLHIGHVLTEPRNPLSPMWTSIPHSCAFSNHSRFKHKGGGNNYCICERKFKDNYSSKRHLSSHEDKLQHCSYCNKSFKH